MKEQCAYCLKECEWLKMVCTSRGDMCHHCQDEYWEKRNAEEELKEQKEKKE